MSADAREVDAVLAAYRAAVLAKDVDGFLRLYDPSARVFDAWGVWSYEGATAWRSAVEAWFGSLGDERVRAGFSAVRTRVDSDTASLSAIVTYAAESSAGAPLRALQNRITWILAAGVDGWRIVHEHTSAPLGFEDGKAILEVEPATGLPE